jgi:signal transduction histidine kinase
MSEEEPAAPPPVGPKRRTSSRWTPILLGFGLIFLVVALTLAAINMRDTTENTRLVQHTLEAQNSINRVAALNERIETARRGYLIQADTVFHRTVDQTSRTYFAEIERLSRLTSDNPAQARRIERIRQLSVQRDELIQRMIEDGGAETRAEIARVSLDKEAGVQRIRAIRGLADEMAQDEQALLLVRTEQQLSSLRQFYITGGAMLFQMLAVIAAVILLIMRYNRRLTAAQAELEVVNEGLELAVATRTTDLVRANQEIQRFAYIVSHDLRSPLVNVLGFTAELDEARKLIRQHLAELYERHPALRKDEPWRAVEEDLPEAIGFIRTSTEKMDRLINSILQLSRQGRRPLAPQDLDLDKLVGEIFATLHQRAQEAGASLRAEPLPSLHSDRLAVEQILTNLIENAIKYGKPGRPGQITVSGQRRGAMVEIDVIDNGRGIDPKDHERIFELFRRSGPQDQPGEGIGLAHVRAMAYRLGGNVTVQSALDRGARFRLSLPAQFIETAALT